MEYVYVRSLTLVAWYVVLDDHIILVDMNNPSRSHFRNHGGSTSLSRAPKHDVCSPNTPCGRSYLPTWPLHTLPASAGHLSQRERSEPTQFASGVTQRVTLTCCPAAASRARVCVRAGRNITGRIEGKCIIDTRIAIELRALPLAAPAAATSPAAAAAPPRLAAAAITAAGSAATAPPRRRVLRFLLDV